MEQCMPSAVPSTALPGRSQSAGDRLAVNLGYLSLALGAVELIAPQAVCRALGLRGLESVVRTYGAREIANGVAILTSHDPEPWVWTRVAGDLADVATVATGLRADNRKRDNSLLAVAGLLAVTAIDIACAKSLGSGKGDRATAITDYSDRSGYPSGVSASRGAAGHFKVPDDMKIPRLLRPFA
jgi:hypothetical protein